MARQSPSESQPRRMRDGVRKSAEDSARQGSVLQLPDGKQLFKPKAEKYQLDVVPYRVSVDTHPYFGKGELADKRTFSSHWNIGPANESVICLAKTYGKACPVCEEVERLRKDGYEKNEKLITALRAKDRVLYNTIDLGEKDQPVRVFETSYHTFTKLMEKEQRDNEERYDYAELNGGLTLEVRFEKSSRGGGKEFIDADRIDFTKREPYENSVLDETVDLDSILRPLDYDTVSRMLWGDTEETPPQERTEAVPFGKQDEAPASSRRRRSSTTASTSGVEEPETPHRRQRGGDPNPPTDQTCPAGGAFGADFDALDACDKCQPKEKWEACSKEFSRTEEEKKAASSSEGRRRRG